MTDDAPARSFRLRRYGKEVRDAGRTFRLAPGVEVGPALKRAALAAIPKPEGWTLRVLTVERTAPEERVAAVLDRLARREAGGPDFAAALVATLDGSRAVLAVAARRPEPVERLRAALGGSRRAAAT